jgi:hypothetical protein
MIANRYRKLEGQKLAVDFQLFDEVLKCIDTATEQQGDSTVTLKASHSMSALATGPLNASGFVNSGRGFFTSC